MAASSQPSQEAAGRKPISRATPKTTAVAQRLRTVLAATCPARIGVPPTSTERKRSMMPPFMSSLTAVAVVAAPNPAQRRMTPGTTYMTYES